MLDTFNQFLIGDLSPLGRVVGAVGPALALGTYFIVGLVAYAIRVARKGEYTDDEIERRGTSTLVGWHIRGWFGWVTGPLWKGLAWTGLPPSGVTTVSALLSMAAGVAFAAGRFSVGGWLYIFSGTLDGIDGRLARATGRATKAGGALDSILDRYADAAVFMGLAWYYRESWVMMAALFALVGSLLTSYIRAKGESLGVDVSVGLVQRAERVGFLGVMTALSPIPAALYTPNDPEPFHALAVVALVVLAVSSQYTAAQRFVYVLLATREPAVHQPAMMARNVVSAVVATAADFALFSALVISGGTLPWLATLVASFAGGVINFALNREWTFKVGGDALPQATRYALVSTINALLNAGGVAVLMLLPASDAWLAWGITRAVVFLAWSFPMQRDYVFPQPAN